VRNDSAAAYLQDEVFTVFQESNSHFCDKATRSNFESVKLDTKRNIFSDDSSAIGNLIPDITELITI
jgi:hypothetical protein